MNAIKLTAAIILLGASMPAFAQSTPATGAMPPPSMGVPGGPPGMIGGPHGKMFGSMSEAGRKTMMMAMKGADPRADHIATKAARDHVLDLLDDDRLDVPALKRAMDAERDASNAERVRHQTAMLAGFQQLSLADRKAFVADARAMRGRMEAGMKAWGGKHGGKHGMGDMPPPPPM